MARGAAQPRPFYLRWLWPALCGVDGDRWRWSARAALVAVCALAWPFTGAWAAVFVPLGLAGVLVNVRCPVLVDLPAMALALGSATVLSVGDSPIAIAASVVLAIAAGATKETAPVFAAAWAWSPWPLVGLLAPAARAILRAPGPDTQPGDTLKYPVRTAYSIHRHQPFAWFVLPWGALVLGLAHPTAQLVVVLGLAYAQLLVAQDLVRLYTWAWPVLASSMFAAVPRAWWLPVVVIHMASPFKGEGW